MDHCQKHFQVLLVRPFVLLLRRLALLCSPRRPFPWRCLYRRPLSLPLSACPLRISSHRPWRRCRHRPVRFPCRRLATRIGAAATKMSARRYREIVAVRAAQASRGWRILCAQSSTVPFSLAIALAPDEIGSSRAPITFSRRARMSICSAGQASLLQLAKRRARGERLLGKKGPTARACRRPRPWRAFLCRRRRP